MSEENEDATEETESEEPSEPVDEEVDDSSTEVESAESEEPEEPAESEEPAEQPAETDATAEEGSASADASDEESTLDGVVETLEEYTGGNVSLIEGVDYGIGLLVYVVGLVLIAAVVRAFAWVFFAISGFLTSQGIPAVPLVFGLIGEVITLLAAIIFLAGAGGLLYKVIADGVKRGMQ